MQPQIGRDVTGQAGKPRADASPPVHRSRHVWIAALFAIAALPAAALMLLGFAAVLDLTGWAWPARRQIGFIASVPQSYGALVALPIVLACAVVLTRWRGAALTGVERALYWFGCAVAMRALLAVAFEGLGWSLLGRSTNGRIGTGALVSLLLGVMWAFALANRRDEGLTGIELGVYWLGCSLLLVSTVAPISTVIPSKVVGDNAVLASLALAAAIGVWLWFRHRRTGAPD